MMHLISGAISIYGDVDDDLDGPEAELLDEIACEVDAGIRAVKERIVEMYASKVRNLKVEVI